MIPIYMGGLDRFMARAKARGQWLQAYAIRLDQPALVALGRIEVSRIRCR